MTNELLDLDTLGRTGSVDDWLDRAVATLDRLSGLPSAALVLLSCIVIGYLLKRSKWFPNDGIPLVVVLVGALLNWLTSAERPDTMPVLVFRVRAIMVGGIIGLGAWGLHYWVRPILLKRMPWLAKLLDAGKEEEAEEEAQQSNKPDE